MANQRLRQAMNQAGLDPDGLAELAAVDVKTVYRWLAGGNPYAKHRAKLAQALGRPEHELWPGVAAPAADQDVRREIQGAWAHANDLGVPDWRALMKDAVEQIDLLGYSLIEVLGTAGVADMLKAKATAGCQVRILIAAPDSVFVAATAAELGQGEQDYIGRSELEREIELARGHLEPLIDQPGVEVHAHYAQRGYTILRFDELMLVHLHLWGTPGAQAPLLYLRRRGDGGLFDQFDAQLDKIAADAGELLEPAPDLYPDPRQHPERYNPQTRERFEQELAAARDHYPDGPRPD